MKKFDILGVLVGFRYARHGDFSPYAEDVPNEVYCEVDVRCTVTTSGGIPTRRQVMRAVRNLGKAERDHEGMKYRQVSHAYVYPYPFGSAVQFYTINPIV